MAKRKKKEHDFSITAHRVVQEATGEAPKPEPSPAKREFDAVKMGKLGGLQGGLARAAALSPERRSEIARKAAQARWGTKT